MGTLQANKREMRRASLGFSSIARDVRDSASRLYEPFHTKIGKKQWVYAFTLFAGPAALEGEAATRIRESKQRSILLCAASFTRFSDKKRKR